MNINKISSKNRAKVIDFFMEHWGSSEMIISSGVYDCAKLDGFLIEENEIIIGLVTYIIHEDEVEVISLDSIIEGRGIGSLLMKEVERFAKSIALNVISLITTNDNLNALKFYQKRGYQIVVVYPNTVEKARQLKQKIPLVSNDGIPIRDELKLVKRLESLK